MELADFVRDVPDFPRDGIVFKDITPLLADAAALRAAVEGIAAGLAGSVDLVCGVESRGFIFGAAVSIALGVGFVPARKSGKLPWDIEQVAYSLEYGEEHLELHRDAVAPGQRVLVVDDVLATGGTAEATGQLVERLGGQVVAYRFLIELSFLEGRAKLAGKDVAALVTY